MQEMDRSDRKNALNKNYKTKIALVCQISISKISDLHLASGTKVKMSSLTSLVSDVTTSAQFGQRLRFNFTNDSRGIDFDGGQFGYELVNKQIGIDPY